MLPKIAGTFRASALADERLRGRRVVPGLPELEEVLPLGGLVAGSLMDLHAEEGAGAFALALRIAAHRQGAPGVAGVRAAALHGARTVVVVDTTGDFHPQAAAQAGVDLARLVVLRRGG